MKIQKLKAKALHSITVIHVRVRKSHFRKGLMIVIITCGGIHFIAPDIEWLIALICNIAFFYDPVIPDDDHIKKDGAQQDSHAA